MQEQARGEKKSHPKFLYIFDFATCENTFEKLQSLFNMVSIWVKSHNNFSSELTLDFADRALLHNLF